MSQEKYIGMDVHQAIRVLYSVRSERMLMEQLDYNLLFRWFVGLNMDDPIWDVVSLFASALP
jgi:transposase